MLNSKSKIKLFTHNDLDGIGCEIIGKLAFENIDVSIVKNPQDASKLVAEFVNHGLFANYDKIFITDISIDAETAKLIDDMEWESHRFVLLDHHMTAVYLNVYDWASVNVQGMMGMEAGTNMFFEYLVMNGFFIKEKYRYALSTFVEKIRRYDTWEWKDIYGDKEALDLNTLFYILGRREFVKKFANKFKQLELFTIVEGDWKEMFDVADTTILRIEEDRKRAYIKRKENQMIVKKLLGHRVGVVFADQYTSELGNTLSEKHGELEFIVIIDLGSRKVSYRTVKDNINLGINIAKKFGGGGHPKASGSEFSSNVPNVVFDAVFGIGLLNSVRKFIDKSFKK